ncbi:uncharacterized protein LOC130244945 [Danio aesculapii]|uniref:uncharacterized protein LOC130244945 n=1 Tax=Danio aesculapii TaxID=1142201 RepID=UPI0024C02557|nr:uncharacterized protein LOC130244945 [Danio aesculapii]
MGNNSAKERHGSSGAAADTYETPPTSPYSVVSTWSPQTQLVSISNCTNTGTPETSQDALSPPLASSVQNEPMLDCKTGPAKEAEEGPNMTHGLEKVSYVSGVCLNGNTEVDSKLLQECLNTLQLNNIEESTHILNDLLQCFLVEREKMKEELRSCKEKIQAEREEWQQFQADLKVALVVSDRLRAEAEEELNTLRAARQDLGTQLAGALQCRREVEGHWRASE